MSELTNIINSLKALTKQLEALEGVKVKEVVTDEIQPVSYYRNKFSKYLSENKMTLQEYGDILKSMGSYEGLNDLYDQAKHQVLVFEKHIDELVNSK